MSQNSSSCFTSGTRRILEFCHMHAYILPDRYVIITTWLLFAGSSWSWSYGSWSNNYLYQCISPPSCEFESCSWPGVLDTPLCDKVCQWHATGQWFSPSTPVSSTNKTDRHNITEILLKVTLNTINQKSNLTMI